MKKKINVSDGSFDSIREMQKFNYELLDVCEKYMKKTKFRCNLDLLIREKSLINKKLEFGDLFLRIENETKKV